MNKLISITKFMAKVNENFKLKNSLLEWRR
jgi:hypothetical protein